MSGGLSLRIGNQSAFSAGLTVPFDLAVQHGFDAFEWFPDRQPSGAGWTTSDIAAPKRQELRSRARDAGIRLSVHASIQADPLKASTHREIEDSLRLAVDLGAALLNIHLTDPYHVDEYAASLGPWIERCSISGLKLAIENTPFTGPDEFNRLFSLLPRTSTVGMCLDIGHANLHHSSHNDYIGYVDRLRSEVPIIHLHFHENHGDRDSHLVLFTGPAGKDPAGILALLDRLDRRGYDGNVVLEQWPYPPEQLVQAKDRLQELLRGRKA